MTNLIIQKLQKLNLQKAPKIEPGMTVRVHQKIKEGEKERIQIFEGLVIAVSSGYGVDKTFTVRKIVEGIGVEKIFPIHSPNIAKIEITKKSKVRRAKLYYMRERFGKSARLKGRFLTEAEKNQDLEEDEPEAEEATPEVEATEAKAEEAAPEVAETEAPAADQTEQGSDLDPNATENSTQPEPETKAEEKPAEEAAPEVAETEAPVEAPAEEASPEEEKKEE